MGLEINGGVVSPFSLFEFSVSIARKRQPLSSVMPLNFDFRYAVVLTDAYLGNSISEVQIKNFEDLCFFLQDESVFRALDKARQSGYLTEGKKNLPPDVVDFLVSVGGPFIYIRFDNNGDQQCRRIDAVTLTSDIVALQSSHNGEFEVCDAGGLWYLRFRDDEPVMFFAAKGKVIDYLTCNFKNNFFAVASDFTYSY